jgi:hypothetical protein
MSGRVRRCGFRVQDAPPRHQNVKYQMTNVKSMTECQISNDARRVASPPVMIRRDSLAIHPHDCHCEPPRFARGRLHEAISERKLRDSQRDCPACREPCVAVELLAMTECGERPQDDCHCERSEAISWRGIPDSQRDCRVVGLLAMTRACRDCRVGLWPPRNDKLHLTFVICHSSPLVPWCLGGGYSAPDSWSHRRLGGESSGSVSDKGDL